MLLVMVQADILVKIVTGTVNALTATKGGLPVMIVTVTERLIVQTAMVQVTILTMSAIDVEGADGMHQERNAMPVTGQDVMW